jgi:ABC-type transport system involved in cytochrome c biogenesis permease subunit
MAQQTVFTIVGSIVLLLWLVALIGYFRQAQLGKLSLGALAFAAGWVLLIGYVLWYWSVLGHPPMRTLKETFLWVVLCLPGIGLLTEWRWRTRALAIITGIGGTALLGFLLLMPEAMDKALPPALRSPWFAPHVIVYMVAYATLLVSAVVAVWALIRGKRSTAVETTDAAEFARRLIYIAFPLLTIGMVLGAFWGKIAWGHYWTWDPKETLAFVTWAMYLAYVHLERYARLTKRAQLFFVVGSFVAVMLCWVVVNYLPSAQSSAHAYAMGG